VADLLSDIDVANWQSNQLELMRLRGIKEVGVRCGVAKIGKTQMQRIAEELAEARKMMGAYDDVSRENGS